MNSLFFYQNCLFIFFKLLKDNMVEEHSEKSVNPIVVVADRSQPISVVKIGISSMGHNNKAIPILKIAL